MDIEKLSQEQEAFDCLLESMLKDHAGEFVVMHKGSIVAYHPTYIAAYEDALKRFGLDQIFLVSEVKKRDPEPVSISWQAGAMFSRG